MEDWRLGHASHFADIPQDVKAKGVWTDADAVCGQISADMV